MSTAELATSYAALILADDGVDITVRLAGGTIERHLLILTGRQAPISHQGRQNRRSRADMDNSFR